MSRGRRTWSLPESDLRALAAESMGNADVVVANRQALKRLTEVCKSFGELRHAVRLIRQALAVDMRIPLNRKGAVPAALGLIADSRVGRKSRAVVLMMDRVLSTPIVDEAARCSDGQCEQENAKRLPCPSRASCRQTFVFASSLEQAAQAVVNGFYYAEIDPSLTVPAVMRTWQRHWKLPAPKRATPR